MGSIKKHSHGSGREAILQATIRVVADKGLRGLTFRAVGDAASVNNSLIAHYFGTRDRLIEAAVEWAVDRSIGITNLSNIVTTPQEYESQLAVSLEEESELQAFQYEMILEARRTPKLRPAIRALYEKYEEALESSLSNFELVSLNSKSETSEIKPNAFSYK